MGHGEGVEFASCHNAFRPRFVWFSEWVKDTELPFREYSPFLEPDQLRD
jgi:hypothetical protein